MSLPTLSQKTVALLGWGRTHRALLPYLLRAGARVTVRDRRPDAPSAQDLALFSTQGVSFFLGEGYLDDLFEEILFRTPVLRPDLPEIQAAISRGAVLSDEYTLFCEKTPATRLAVTGSDGKTTTATLVHRLLRAAGCRAFLGGNIGLPLVSLLPEMRAGDFAVCELSSFQLMSAPPPPARAAVTNISENHLNWHRDMEEYVAAKERVLGTDTACVLRAHDPYTPRLLTQASGEVTLFSLEQNRAALDRLSPNCHTIYLEKGDICLDGEAVVAVREIRLPGRHNIENYMAALGLTFPYLGDAAPVVRQVAAEFGGVPHRLEFIREVRGVCFYNSSIDSTPTRTAAALAALPSCTRLLCGGRGKGLSPAPLVEAVARAPHLRAVYLFGECRATLSAALSKCRISLIGKVTMREAVEAAAEDSRAGDCVLLSPACTSFDEFSDFEARGEAFRRLVQSL